MYTEYSHPRPEFHTFLLYDQPFLRYRDTKIEIEKSKWTQWPQNDLNHLSVKSTRCTLNTCPRGPNFILFRSMTSRFRDTSFSKSKWTQWTQNDFNHLSVKNSPYIHWILEPRGPNFNPFCSTTSHFRDTGSLKIENAPNDPRMTLSIKCQKYLVYTEYSPPRQKIQYVSFYGQPFSRCIKVVKNLNHWSVRSNLYTLNTHPRCPNFTHFRSVTSCLRDTRLSKIGNVLNELNHLTVKSTLYIHWMLNP